VVEYWCRQDYLDLELHSDIDEELFLQSSRKNMQHLIPRLRYPDFGHVLYLTANDKMAVGPTCIFPYKLGGWNVTTNTAADDDAISIHHHNNEEEEEEEEEEASSTATSTAMVVVPFVPGRLVRFPGSAMHGVPKPCNKWSLSKSEQQELEWLDEQVEDDEDSSVSTTMMRSVLLFNLWNETGPLGVTTRMKDGPKKEFEDHTVMVVPTIPDGIVLSDEDDSDSYCYQPTSGLSSCESGNQTASIQTVNSITTPDPFHGQCRPVSEWRKSNWINPAGPVFGSLLSSPSSPSTRNWTCLTIPLMGTNKRRFHSKKFVTLDLTGETSSGEEQHERGSTPTRFWLTERT
jgi:hypothetical protein